MLPVCVYLSVHIRSNFLSGPCLLVRSSLFFFSLYSRHCTCSCTTARALFLFVYVFPCILFACPLSLSILSSASYPRLTRIVVKAYQCSRLLDCCCNDDVTTVEISWQMPPSTQREQHNAHFAVASCGRNPLQIRNHQIF